MPKQRNRQHHHHHWRNGEGEDGLQLPRASFSSFPSYLSSFAPIIYPKGWVTRDTRGKFVIGALVMAAVCVALIFALAVIVTALTSH